MDNKKRRDAQLPYISDLNIMLEQERTRLLIRRYNRVIPMNAPMMTLILKKLLGSMGKFCYIEPPFRCDYGSHIFVGENFIANYNLTVLDVAPVRIGDNCLVGPNVSIFTAGHPVHPEMRNTGLEYGIEINIGDNVWIGGCSVINPGVTIGSNTVIASGSVVTKDIPDNVIAGGNPCKVIREITDEDRKYYYKNLEFDEEALEEVKNITELDIKQILIDTIKKKFKKL
ncbi:MAG: sugar O-acetyltransferase [Clostridia bacterium]|nr:sugar O-acetyltransferase [Clostridia bacterium]MBR0027406.1 sugar O-acetyltransferase [Clostridia bacterium]